MPVGNITWEALEMSAYQQFRITEAEHMAKSYPTWVDNEYERHLFDAYEASLVCNGAY